MLFVILFTGNLKRDELCIKKNEYKWTIVCIVFVLVIGHAKNNLRKCRTDQIPIIKKKKRKQAVVTLFDSILALMVTRKSDRRG